MFQKNGPFASSSLFLSLPLSSSLRLFVSLSLPPPPLFSSLFLSFPLLLSFFNVHSANPANYLKTQDVRLKVPNAPKSHLNQLKTIFDNGVTVWHVENGNMFENTEKDNVEV